LQLFRLQEEQLKVEAKERELELIQRDNELKELALEKERLIASEREQRLKAAASRERLKLQREEQRRRADQQEYENRLQFIVGLLLFFILIILVILIAYRQLRKRKKRIEEQNLIIAESKKEIELQKEKSDNLLLNILPQSVAEELKANGAAKPRLYNDISVGFTDFSGFTMISEQLSPEDLVAQLDAMFLEFDKIIEKHGLQRIKTIGDAYMFAAGLPEPMEDHATRSIRAAIEMRDFIDEFNKGLKPENPSWNIRIGVHSGPVVAGVIGIKKFAYDIWGDTVNTAARMESSGEIGKVNISGETKDHINGEFKTEHRGKVKAKNKGAIEMYFVELK
jgi:class 3 adenylate cyclase